MTQELSSKLKPESVIAIIDSREQLPLNLSPLRTALGTLATGDYALLASPDVCRVERKSLPDLVACVGSERERFDREVARLLAYPVRILVVEATWQQIESHEATMPQWRGKVSRESVIGSLLNWQAQGLSIHMAGDHHHAGRYVARLLFTIARRRYRELREFVSAATEPFGESTKEIETGVQDAN